MRIEDNITHGIFRCEIKNRFRCLVEVEGKNAICYVASSCRLSQFMQLEGKEVLLLPKGSNAANTEYTLLAVKKGNGYVLLNLSLANSALLEQLNRRSFSFLGSRKDVHREATISNYKTDIYVSDTKTLIEIKTIISVKAEASFPTVYSERSVEQLGKLLKALESGFRVCYLFAVLSPSVKTIRIEKDSAFYEAFLNCVNKGMVYRACRIKTTESEIKHNGFLEVIL